MISSRPGGRSLDSPASVAEPLTHVQRADRSSLAPYLLLLAALLVSAGLLIALSSGLSFYQDTWAFLIQRRPFDVRAFFEPHNEHIVVIPVAVYKLLLAAFGMTSTTPFRVVSTLLLVGRV